MGGRGRRERERKERERKKEERAGERDEAVRWMTQRDDIFEDADLARGRRERAREREDRERERERREQRAAASTSALFSRPATQSSTYFQLC